MAARAVRPLAVAPPAAPVLAYVAGSVVGGAFTGLVLGWIGSVARAGLSAGDDVVLLTAALLALTGAVCELRGRVSPLPERRAQVPRNWVRWSRPSLVALAFGVLIGTGAATYIKHAVAYVLAAIAILAPSLGVAILIGAFYGLSKGALVTATWTSDRLHKARPPMPTLGINRLLGRTLVMVGAFSFAASVYLVA